MFTLGIGGTVSTAMCEGIARIGNGVCLMAATSESIIAKSAKLVRASRGHFLTNSSISWGTDFAASSDVTSQSSMLCQAPSILPPLYSGNRFVAFVLLKHQDFVVPETITIRARQQDGQGKELSFTVTVKELSLPMDDPQPQFIHTLAARKTIQDLDDAERGASTQAAKSTIVHLGEQYQLASRYTSFIAVDNSGVIADVSPSMPSFIDSNSGVTKASFRAPSAPITATSAVPSAIPLGSQTKRLVGMRKVRMAAPRKQQAQQMQSMTAQPLSLPALSSYSSGTAAAHDADVTIASFGPGLLDHRLAPPSLSSYGSNITTANDVDTTVFSLVRLQSFDGSFQPSPALENIVGRGALVEAQNHSVDETVWATVLAVTYLKKHLTGQPELLEGLVEKAMDFLSQYGVNVQGLLDAANSAIS